MARTVLLADDSVTAQNMGRRILIDAGYEVITVNNGSAALKKIHESRPDLIVLDVYMPGYGGLEVCQRLKESNETSRIPILLTVGKMEPFKTDEARRARADGHIVKPFDAGELLAALAKLEDKIVPRQESSRGRRGKSERKSRPWQVADPAMSYDDSHSDKIAYLAEVKQRHRASDPGENGSQSPPAAVSTTEAAPVADPPEQAETSELPFPEGPKMPRPMSVYAAEQLQELPVVAESVPQAASQHVDIQKQDPSGQSTPTEGKSETAEVRPVKVEDPVAAAAPEETSVAQSESTHVQEVSVASTEPTAEAASETVESAPDASSTPVEGEAQPAPELAHAVEQFQTVAPRWTAENVALTAEEASVELEREMQEAQARAAAPKVEEASSPDATSVSPPEARSVSDPEVTSTSTPQEPTESDENNGATFAAAAAASSSSLGSVSVTGAEAQPEPPAGSEAAAAWRNWQQIRDSVVGAQSANADSISEMAQSSVPSQTAQNQEPPAETSDEDALSSLVDSVLAELKPKLMAEISKKLKK